MFLPHLFNPGARTGKQCSSQVMREFYSFLEGVKANSTLNQEGGGDERTE